MAEYCEYEWNLRRHEIDLPCHNEQKKVCDKKQAVIAVRQFMQSRPDIGLLHFLLILY